MAWPQPTSIMVAPNGVEPKLAQDPATSRQVCPPALRIPPATNRTEGIPAAACRVLRLEQVHLTLPCSQELAAVGTVAAEDASIGLYLTVGCA
jgi:hypothetical protein